MRMSIAIFGKYSATYNTLLLEFAFLIRFGLFRKHHENHLLSDRSSKETYYPLGILYKRLDGAEKSGLDYCQPE